MNDGTNIRLVVGLGNPGPEYAGTRHNAGFEVIGRLLAAMPAGRFELRHVSESFVHAGSFRGRNLFLQLPQTFMNASGLAVAGFARKNGILPEEILVISDDLDLPVGRLRLRAGGADGGHNGLKSVAAELGSSAFRRLRVGVGRPEPGGTVDYVLSKFEDAEREEFEKSLVRAAEAVRCVLTAGLARAMNQFNVRLPEEKEQTTK